MFKGLFKPYQTIYMHGFSTNKMYENKHRTNDYNNWQETILREMTMLKELKELKVNPNKPIGISIEFNMKQCFDLDNMIKSFLDSLVLYYKNEGLANDNNICEIHMKKNIINLDDVLGGSIKFKLYNI
jgi:Holliday junction resolvase RusA-like endonuclease